MSRNRLLMPILAALVAAVALAAPTLASAELAYIKNPVQPVVFQASDDGASPHRIGPGRQPQVAPDGKSIAYVFEASPGSRPLLKIAPVAGGTVEAVLENVREDFRWSPDSEMIAALKGGELGKRTLVLLDVKTGEQTEIARGFFAGFNFSPDGSELVYAVAGGNYRYPLRSDIFRVSTGEGRPKAITHDHNSSFPVWGSQGRIVFVKTLGAKTRKYTPKNELYSMTRQGAGVEKLTTSKVPQLAQGLFPTAFSANGAHLIAEFGGQDLSYGVKVNPDTGAQAPLVEATEQGFVATAISRNGKLVLGYEGGFEPSRRQTVAVVPYAGGKPKVLVRGATEPSWSR